MLSCGLEPALVQLSYWASSALPEGRQPPMDVTGPQSPPAGSKKTVCEEESVSAYV